MLSTCPTSTHGLGQVLVREPGGRAGGGHLQIPPYSHRASPQLRLHTHAYMCRDTHTCTYAHLPSYSVSHYLLFLPVASHSHFLSLSLFLSLSIFVSLSRFFLLLFLVSDFISLGVFKSLLTLFLSFSSSSLSSPHPLVTTSVFIVHALPIY